MAECIECGNPHGRRPHAIRCHPCSAVVEVLRRRAMEAVGKLIRTWRLRPAHHFKCVDCGAPAVCYDHRDYSQPEMVDPVCMRCNKRRGPAKVGAQVIAAFAENFNGWSA